MFPVIIYLLWVRYRKTHPEKVNQVSKFIVLFIILVLTCLLTFSQIKHLQYSVKKNDTPIGTISFSFQISGNKKVLVMESKIKTRWLILFTAIGREEAVFDNDVMISSSVYQKLNGNEKINKRTTLIGRNYTVSNGTQQETLSSYPITYNMICLYDKEPVDVPKVYSDKFQQFLPIQTVADHHYRIKFPDGNFNEYYYKEGRCVRVEVHHSLFRSTFELQN